MNSLKEAVVEGFKSGTREFFYPVVWLLRKMGLIK